MVVVASRIGGGPSDNGQVVMGNFERWPFDDLDVLDSRLRRRILSDDRAAKEQAARCGGGRPYPEQSIHRTNPLSLPLNSRRKEWGSTAAPRHALSRPYGIGGDGTGGTPPISPAQGDLAGVKEGVRGSSPLLPAVSSGAMGES